MTKEKLSNSFLIRVFSNHANEETIHLQNIRTGETQVFSSWDDVLAQLKKQKKTKGLR